MNAQAQTQTKQNNSVVVGGRTYTHTSTDRRFLARIIATDLVHDFLPNMLAVREAGTNFEATVRCTEKLYAPYSESQFEPIPEVDWTPVEVDTPVWVRTDSHGEWHKRHFAHYASGLVYAWKDGHTSHTTQSEDAFGWAYASLTGPNT